jgi:hypothetical protein
LPAEGNGRPPASFRYGAVLVLVFALLVLQIAAPGADWSRALALLLEAAALVVIVATTREREEVRRARTAVLSAAAVVVALLVALGDFPVILTFAIATVMLLVIPVTLAGGLAKLVRTQGVNVQVVAGAIVIYLVVGLIFAFVISIVAHAGTSPYFTQGTDGTQSDRVYFSFTVLTTTGFGDLTAATRGGKAMAVVEMLLGQLYLVTVIGVIVGSLASRRRA